MHEQQQAQWSGHLVLIAFGMIVLAFMGLSLAITATGTARFAAAMGYRAEVGYAVGGVFDVAKALLPVALMLLLLRRAFLFSSIFAFAWLGLVTYSALATHSTVSAAIAAIERNGDWKMEGRANLKAELSGIEQRLAALSEPKIPRPSGGLREALTAEKVPPDVWRDSQECLSIRGDKYFQKACAKVLELRRELAASEDYERLDLRARYLRQDLAATAIVSTTDPLPEAFTATVGRMVPLQGRVGVAVLLTFVVEIMSCFGLAALRVLREGQKREAVSSPLPGVAQLTPGTSGGTSPTVRTSKVEILSREPSQIVPQSSPRAASMGAPTSRQGTSKGPAKPPSNVLPMRAARPMSEKGRSSGALKSSSATHASDFAHACLRSTTGISIRACDLRSRYNQWCAERGLKPLSQQKLGAELARLGFAKWKSCGLIRYRDVQLAA